MPSFSDFHMEKFNANDENQMRTYEPLPAGDYLACIISSEMKQTRAGNGNYLELCFSVLEGQFEGRKLFVRLNLDNPSDAARGIARAELAAICKACGIVSPECSEDLHEIAMIISVRVKKRLDNGELNNQISNYKQKPQQTKQTQQTPPNKVNNGNNNKTSKPNWARRDNIDF